MSICLPFSQLIAIGFFCIKINKCLQYNTTTAKTIFKTTTKNADTALHNSNTVSFQHCEKIKGVKIPLEIMKLSIE